MTCYGIQAMIIDISTLPQLTVVQLLVNQRPKASGGLRERECSDKTSLNDTSVAADTDRLHELRNYSGENIVRKILEAKEMRC